MVFYICIDLIQICNQQMFHWQIKIIIMSSQPNQLQTFTSILSLLSVQHPYIYSQLQYLRKAVIKWYQEVQLQKLSKNKAIVAAKSRGDQKLAILFNKIDNYFCNLFRCYNDPNLKLFYHQFSKIKEEFQFIDLELGKFKQKCKNKEIQTQKENVVIFGIDVDKLTKSLDNKQFQLQQAKYRISQMEDQNQKLRNMITNLTNQMKQVEEYSGQIKQLKEFLEKTKAQALTSRCQTQKKISPNYRSNPEIMHSEFISNRKIIKNLLTHAYEDSLMYHVQPENTSLEQVNTQDPEIFRFVYSQAVAIQGILETVASYQKANKT